MDPSLSGIDAVILAGGLGSRLRGVLPDRPKAMAAILGRPFLAHLLDHLQAQGLSRVVVCTGFLGDQIEGYFGGSHGRIQLHYSRESHPLGTAGALALAARQVVSETCLVLNGDSFLAAPLGPFYRWYREQGIVNGILLASVADRARYGGVTLRSDGSLERFFEKSQKGPGLINAGVYLLRTMELRRLPVDRAISLERDLFPAWTGHSLHGFPCEGAFLDIGTPETYGLAEGFFAKLLEEH